MNVTLIAAGLGLALAALLQHHRRAVERHDRIIDAWRLLLRLVERRPPAPSRSPPKARSVLGPRAKRPGPPRLRAGNSSRS